MARRPRLLSPGLLIRRQAIAKGVFGPSSGWRVVAAIVFGRQLLKRFAGKSETIVANEVLHPGQLLQIETIAPRTKAERKQARKLAS